MTRPAGLLLCLTLGVAVAVGAEPSDGKRRPPFSDAEYWAGVWEDPSRDEWQKRLIVLSLLGLRQGDRVADLGAGTGYFTEILAIAVGNAGRVYAVELEPSLLDHIMARQPSLSPRIVPVLAAPADPRLPEGEIDVVLMVNTWHHIKSRPKYLRRLARCLAPGGRVAVIDFRDGELPVGPPPGEKVSRDQVVREFEKAGWELVTESVALPYQYFLIFMPPGTGSPEPFLLD
jgi:ubiquinone/menaquinone biosynthesis C-methylase UbiE